MSRKKPIKLSRVQKESFPGKVFTSWKEGTDIYACKDDAWLTIFIWVDQERKWVENEPVNKEKSVV